MEILDLLIQICKHHLHMHVCVCTYSTAHIQVYKLTRVMHHVSRNFACNSRVGLV